MFKITIQPGSALDHELSSLTPRQRNSRLIELATIGLAFSKSQGPRVEQGQNAEPVTPKKSVDDFVTCEKMTTSNSTATLVTEKQNSVVNEPYVTVGNTDFGQDLLSM